jgi:hypothetical protein
MGWISDLFWFASPIAKKEIDAFAAVSDQAGSIRHSPEIGTIPLRARSSPQYDLGNRGQP